MTDEIKKKIDAIWYSRNPQHEANADTGEDMFYDTMRMCMQDYANEFAQSQLNDKQHTIDHYVEVVADMEKEIERLRSILEMVYLDAATSINNLGGDTISTSKKGAEKQWQQFKKDNKL